LFEKRVPPAKGGGRLDGTGKHVLVSGGRLNPPQMDVAAEHSGEVLTRPVDIHI
jgi:hypothetical protein